MKHLLLILMLLVSCKADTTSLKKSSGRTVMERFSPPLGTKRSDESEESFAHYLRTLPLKKDSSFVHYFDGGIKPNNYIYEAVIDLPIGTKDLHQCADAVMRLRGEYLYKEKKFDKLHFNFTNGFTCSFNRWRKGERIGIKGNKTWWKKSASPSESYQTFWKFMEQVFMYAGTYSLNKELHSVSDSTVAIGDVFIQGGFPGHALIIVDKAIDTTTNEIYFMLAQSYMPAQETQILTNQMDLKISPWYRYKALDYLETPEWDFEWSERKRFRD